MIETIIQNQEIKSCDYPVMQEVTHERMIRKVVTGNQYYGNHFAGGYSPQGFDIFSINNIQFQAPIGELSIYQQEHYYVIEFLKSSFYLVPKLSH